MTPASGYAAEYLRSVFTPGTTAPLHVHSGPEAFYAIDGDTYLETPEGVRIGRGPGKSLITQAAQPMLLAGGTGGRPTTVEPWLGRESKRWWQKLDRSWEGGKTALRFDT